MIIVLGDSHASIFSKKNQIINTWPKKDFHFLSKFKPIRIGPATAYNLKNKTSLLNSVLDETFYFKNSFVIFCFGEVDIRAHLLRQSVLQNKKIDYLVMECVDRYVDCINSLKPKKPIQKAVFGPIASWSHEKPYDGPSYGTILERNNTTRIFNEYLEKITTKNDITFVSIFHDLLNKDGTTNSYYLDNLGSGIHLNTYSIPLIMKELRAKNII